MDRAGSYPDIVKGLISSYAQFLPSYADVRAETVIDDEHGHYIPYYTGWDGKDRVHGSGVHIDLIDGKVWVQHDGTEEGVVDDLIKAGIPESDIVLGFHHPDLRKYTEFAVA